MDARDNISLCEAKKVMYQILSALDFLHARSIIHRDVKPQNILVDTARNTFKLADLGLCRFIGEKNGVMLSANVCTLAYKPPELLVVDDANERRCARYVRYDGSLDIWSLGCVMAELSRNGRPIFRGERPMHVLLSILRKLGTPDFEKIVSSAPGWVRGLPRFESTDLQAHLLAVDHLSVGLLRQMLCLYPDKRISAAAALQHPFLQT
jgi:serine/threonine protein kinase